MILRTIFEGDSLIDARVIPLAIDRYRPVPIAGAAATRVIRLVDGRSALTAYSDRIEPRLDIDDVRLIEWRDPGELPDGMWIPVDALRGSSAARLSVEQSGCAEDHG